MDVEWGATPSRCPTGLYAHTTGQNICAKHCSRCHLSAYTPSHTMSWSDNTANVQVPNLASRMVANLGSDYLTVRDRESYQQLLGFTNFDKDHRAEVICWYLGLLRWKVLMTLCLDTAMAGAGLPFFPMASAHWKNRTWSEVTSGMDIRMISAMSWEKVSQPTSSYGPPTRQQGCNQESRWRHQPIMAPCFEPMRRSSLYP